MLPFMSGSEQNKFHLIVVGGIQPPHGEPCGHWAKTLGEGAGPEGAARGMAQTSALEAKVAVCGAKV